MNEHEAFSRESGPEDRDRDERFLLATENAELAEQCRRLVHGLWPRAVLEVVPEDGRQVLARMRARLPRFAFVPAGLRHLDSLTLLRALAREEAQRVVLLVPTTLNGYRVAWEALGLAAADVFPTPRAGATRIKGDEARWLRRLALLADEQEETDAQVADLDDGVERPWVVYPELRQLPALARGLRNAPRTVPLVLRVPEGPRVHQVVREELDRIFPWPIRDLIDGDLLVPGHLHLFTEPWLLRIESSGARHRARLCPPMNARRGFAPRADLLSVLGHSAAGFLFISGEPLEPEEEERVIGADRSRRRSASIVPLLRDPEPREWRRAA